LQKIEYIYNIYALNMGHDIYLKNCPSPLNDTCISCGRCNHECETNTGLSFNFSKYSDYWSVAQAHGHKGSVIIIQLKNAIDRLTTEGIGCKILGDQDSWTSDINVFHFHMHRLLAIMQDNQDCIMLSDQVGSFVSDPNDAPDAYESESDTDSVDDSVQIDDADPQTPGPIIYYQHPIKGKVEIDNFAKACEIFTMMTISGDTQASQWLDLAKIMHDAP
jgi:ferredoxin